MYMISLTHVRFFFSKQLGVSILLWKHCQVWNVNNINLFSSWKNVSQYYISHTLVEYLLFANVSNAKLEHRDFNFSKMLKVLFSSKIEKNIELLKNQGDCFFFLIRGILSVKTDFENTWRARSLHPCFLRKPLAFSLYFFNVLTH